MADQKDSRRRSMVGVPPTKRAPEKSKKGKVVVEEEESNHEGSSNSDDDDDEGMTESQAKDGNSPGRKRRKKRRVRLTDYGVKAKKRAERRERVDRKEVPEVVAESPRKDKEALVEEEVYREPKFERYQPFQLLCDHLLRKFIEKDPEEFFSQPVVPSLAPDYHQVIETPMDFYTMRRKVDSNEYTNIEELKKDVGLIAENAMAYNKPSTVYYLAAQKLQFVLKYYFSDQYLEYLRYSLPFGNEIPHELLGLKPKVPIRTFASSSRTDARVESLRAAITDKVDSKTVLKQNSASNRCKLSEKKPNWHLGYIDKKKEGPVTLNIVTGDDKPSILMGDFIGHLEKGTSCLPSNYELFEEFDAPISYTNYGNFCSFAPQFDSTWATLSKRDSDALMSCYGDKQNAIDVFTLRQFAADSSDSFMKVVDGLLDTLTDGEHSRTLKQFEKKEEEKEEQPAEEKEMSEQEVRKILTDVVSLENFGLDMSYLSSLRSKFGLEEKEPTVDEVLDSNARMISDLNTLQQNRLSADVAFNLNDVAQPSQTEVSLAGRVVQQLSNGIAQYSITPANVSSTAAVHQAVGLNDDECDYKLLSEFMVIE